MNTRSSTITLPFRNRSEAGRMLASRLADYCGRPDVIVLGLPRGGVPVAYEVAQELVLPSMSTSCESSAFPAMRNRRWGPWTAVAFAFSTAAWSMRW